MKEVHFAKHLGKKILSHDKEYILYGVTTNHLLGMNGSPEPVPLSYEECRMIFNNEIEFGSKQIPLDLAVYRAGDKYVNVSEVQEETDELKEAKILQVICECSGITTNQLQTNTKSRNPVFVQARQIHMTIRQLIIYKESLEFTGNIYGKDHATVLHAIRVVTEALDGFNIPFRNKYKKVFQTLICKYPTKADNRLNLKWL